MSYINDRCLCGNWLSGSIFIEYIYFLSHIVLIYHTKNNFHFFTFIFLLCNDFTNAKDLEMFISTER